jgi:hypothetical protein
MASLRSFLLTLAGYLAITSSGYGAQPPDVVVSDTLGNTAMGTRALLSLSGGNENTAAGYDSLTLNTTGRLNTAYGAFALFQNTTGTYNTGTGHDALISNTTGDFNTASGAGALGNNSTGSANTALGFEALSLNTSGTNNTASGYEALYSNRVGIGNAAFGIVSLFSNTDGQRNAALGGQSLNHNTTGNFNTAVGFEALWLNTTGSNNVGVGLQAGYHVTTGSNNIEIANTGVAGDNGKIRIGTQGTQSATYIAGISGSLVTGAAVYVTPAGQLGVLASSERYKTAIASMGSSTDNLKQLRPVTFRLKTDPKAGRQYGLIAEEVAKVYPELVIRNEAGQAEGVRYEELTPMLVNEVQRQQQELQALKKQVAALEELQRKVHR